MTDHEKHKGEARNCTQNSVLEMLGDETYLTCIVPTKNTSSSYKAKEWNNSQRLVKWMAREMRQ